MHDILHYRVILKYPTRCYRITTSSMNQSKTVSKLYRILIHKIFEISLITNFTIELPSNQCYHIQEFHRIIYILKEGRKFFYTIQKQIINLFQFFIQLLECIYFVIKQILCFYRIIERIVIIFRIEFIIFYKIMVWLSGKQQR